MQDFPDSHIDTIKKLAKKGYETPFVVGGTIRDLVLNRPFTDIDIAMDRAAEFAKKFAELIGKKAVVLDNTPKRETIRVPILKNLFFDFTQLQGENIHEDLQKRDFTINALALSLDNFQYNSSNFVDPLNGLRDLKDKILRVASDSAFTSDPLRMLRAFRFSAGLNFQIHPETLSLIHQQCESIQRVSSERIIHELRLLLQAPCNDSFLKTWMESGLLKSIFPEFDFSSKFEEGTLKTFRFLEGLFFNPKTISEKQELLQALRNPSLLYLSRFTALFLDLIPIRRISKSPQPRRKKQLSIAGTALKRLRASNKEIKFVENLVRVYIEARLSRLEFLNSENYEEDAFQFLYQFGEETIPGLCLYLARQNVEKAESTITQQTLERVRTLIDFYIEKVLPQRQQPPLMNGRDLMKKFNLPASKSLNHLIRKIESAQALGIINTSQDAEEYVKKLIHPDNPERRP